MVDPDYQRRGIGRMLLKHVLAETDAAGIPSFIVSSFEAHGLYQSLGFVDLQTWHIDQTEWSREIEQLEKELGIPGNEGLAERCRGKKEMEALMKRNPQT
jgi:predicted N-acetyltransferase YhbS